MSSPATESSALALSQHVAELVFGPLAARPVTIRYWDSGVTEPAMTAPAAVTIVLQHPGAFRRLLLPPTELRMAEAILRGDVEVDGDLEMATHLGREIRRRFATPRDVLRLFRLLFGLPATRQPRGERRLPFWRRALGKHSLDRDAAAVRSHYDVSNDFYALWLDRNMVYSCGYFEQGSESLDAAQLAKLEHICRKLHLKPGERLLDIGCGWGGLIRYAVNNYGVTALGITLSEEQARLARQRIAADGLSERCEVQVRDYRTLADLAPFDKVASVGMAEHVGAKQLPAYFDAAYRLTKPGGLFLLHCITAGRRPPASRLGSSWREGKFTERYVFPDGELVPLHALEEAAYHIGYEARDVESLREHYALTLREWTHRLEDQREAAVGKVGETNYRIWRLNMAGAAASFANGKHNLIQMLLARPDEEGKVQALPLTRRDLYRLRTPAQFDRMVAGWSADRDPFDRRSPSRPRAPAYMPSHGAPERTHQPSR